MAFWPVKPTSRAYPHLCLGSNFITLVKNDGRFEWVSAQSQAFLNTVLLSPGHRANRFSITASPPIFPPTRSPQKYGIQTTIVKYAEQGANFIRTQLPDVDIPADLMREEISKDAEISKELQNFDPNFGNLLADVKMFDHTKTFLAFPMGELFQELNLSELRISGDKMVFYPAAQPLKVFETPIQQISASKASILGTYLSIRTFGYTSVLRVAAEATLALTEVIKVFSSDTDDRPLVDFSFSTAPPRAFAVSDRGGLYEFNIVEGTHSLSLIGSPVENVVNRMNTFWRVARTMEDACCLLASSKTLKAVDLRSKTVSDLFSIPQMPHVLTSVEDESQDHLIRLCTTEELVWIDRRFPGKPLLGYAHGREFDRSLEAQKIPSSETIILTSKKNKMITLYDVSRSGELIYFENLPYCLFPNKFASDVQLGQTFISSEPIFNAACSSLVRLSDRGSLHQIVIHKSHLDGDPVIEASWSREIRQLGAKAPLDKNEDHDLANIDFTLIYDKAFSFPSQEVAEEKDDSADAEATNLAGRMEALWQEPEMPNEYITNTYDAIVRAADSQDFRADFFEGETDNLGGYHAIAKSHPSAKILMKKAPWHWNLTATLQCFDLDFTDDVIKCRDKLRQYDLAEEATRSAHLIKLEQKAQEQLSVDLVLSADVFSSREFSRTGNDYFELESMTKTLSMDEEPPDLTFGYLRPVPLTQQAEEGLQRLGVRRLLKEWTAGTERNCLRVDRPGDSNDDQLANQAERNAMLRSQPPPIVRANANQGSRLAGVQSQSWELDGASQMSAIDFGISSTQIVAGRYGSRTGKKKRLGGF